MPARVALRPARFCTDAQLVRRAACGEEHAFAEIFARHHQAVYRYCRSLLCNGEDAADALQNTMASVLRSLDGETREIALKPWLFRVAHNEAISIARRARPQSELDDGQPCTRLSVEGDVLASERLREVIEDVQALPERQRGALVMRELSGLDYQEIAAVFGIAEGAARQAVHEARGMLHELAEGRAMQCDDVRELIGARDGRLLRGRKVRAHLRACDSCTQFRGAIAERQGALALGAPPLAVPLATSILSGLLGGGHGGSAAAAGTCAGASVTAATSAAPIGKIVAVSGLSAKAAGGAGVATKAVAAMSAVVALGGGAVVAEQQISAKAPATAQPQTQSLEKEMQAGGAPSATAGSSTRSERIAAATAAAARSASPAGKGASTGASTSATSKGSNTPSSTPPAAAMPAPSSARRPIDPTATAPKGATGSATAATGKPSTPTNANKPTSTPTANAQKPTSTSASAQKPTAKQPTSTMPTSTPSPQKPASTQTSEHKPTSTPSRAVAPQAPAPQSSPQVPRSGVDSRGAATPPAR